MQKETKKQNLHFIIDFFSGGAAGAISKTITAPLERVKLILQTERDNPQVTKKYRGLVDCFLRCVREQGTLSLWRGNWANILRYFPTQALNFSFKEQTSNLLNVNQAAADESHKAIYVMKSILAGGLAGCGTSLIVYPLDFARTRMGVDIGRTKEERQFKSLSDCIRKVYSAQGIRGIYAGLNSCLFGIFIYRGLYFGFYDSGKHLLLTPEMERNYFIKFLFAQCVVMLSETVSYPTDTIKRRLMMQGNKPGEPKRYKNAFDCTAKIWREEGVNGFMRGCFSNLLRGVGSALCLVLYDEFKNMSQLKFNKQTSQNP